MVELWEKCKWLNAIWCRLQKGRYCILYSESERGNRGFKITCNQMEAKK